MSAYELQKELDELTRGLLSEITLQGVKTRQCFKDYDCGREVGQTQKAVDSLSKASTDAIGSLVGLVGADGKITRDLVQKSREAIKGLGKITAKNSEAIRDLAMTSG